MELGNMLQQLAGGMLITTEIFVLTLLFSLPLGLFLSFGRMSKIGVLRFITKIYISVMRGTPLMLQLIVVYFAPYYVFGMKISKGYRMVAVILAFVLNYAAYFAEIYRSGIESMPVGQYEAAKILGYSRAQTFVKIILPQVIKRVLPAVTNEMITLVKDTSLAFVLTVTEMFTIAKQIAAAQASVAPLMAARRILLYFQSGSCHGDGACGKTPELLQRLRQKKPGKMQGKRFPGISGLRFYTEYTDRRKRNKMSGIFLEINHMKKSFGELEVIKDISLTVKEGEVVSIIGPSGSGKSTLLRCATMLEKMDGGELSFLGEKAAHEENGRCVYASRADLKRIHKHFGLVFQSFNLFRITAS